MPRVRGKRDAPDPDTIYVANQGGAALIDGIEYSWTTGEQRRGDDPVVRAQWQHFSAQDVPRNERPGVFHDVVARHDAEQPALSFDVQTVHAPQPIEREDVRILVRPIVVAIGPGKDKQLVEYPEGTIFRNGSELVTALPDAFGPPRWR